MRNVTLCLMMFCMAGCATMFKSSRQNVFFNGGPAEGITYVQTPDGKFELEGGSGSYLMTRSRDNIPITVTCPGQKSRPVIIETRFDWLVGGALNFFTYGIGWFIDPFSEKAYDIPSTVPLGQVCK